MKYQVIYKDSADKILLTEITDDLSLVDLYKCINLTMEKFPDIRHYTFIKYTWYDNIYKESSRTLQRVFKRICKLLQW